MTMFLKYLKLLKKNIAFLLKVLDHLEVSLNSNYVIFFVEVNLDYNKYTKLMKVSFPILPLSLS